MNYKRLVPPDTFIGQYMQMTSTLETSSAYDFWAATWALGTCLGRGVYVPRPHAPVYMNWYIMFIAESGVTRKSTAVRMARDVVSAVLGVDSMIEGKSTPEYIFARLVEHPHLAISVSELVTFLGRESYIIELPALLTDLYDCPPQKRGGTVTKGEQVIEDAFVTFLTASTPSWLRTSVNPTVIEGGFTSRCLFIHDEKPKMKIAWPDEGKIDVTHVIDLLKDTVVDAQAVKTIELLPAALRRFSSWYRQRDTTSIVPFVASFNSREDGHVLRLASCLCINDGTLAVDVGHINKAIKLIALVKASAVQMFSDRGNTIKVAQGIDRTLQLLVDAGPIGIAHTRLYTGVRYYMQRDEFHILMTSLGELNMVAHMVDKREGGGRKGIRYVRTQGITNHNKLAEVMATFT